MFQVNDLVMYGSTGVCKVKEIGKPEFLESDDIPLYYFLEPLYQNGLIYVPVNNEAVEMRHVISAEEANDLLQKLDDIEVKIFKGRSMQQLSQHYQKIIDSHDCDELLSMTKSIYIKAHKALINKKRIGQIDKRFMRKAQELIFGEIAVALDTEKDKVEEYVHSEFKKDFEANYRES